jgi:hypothetical protein
MELLQAMEQGVMSPNYLDDATHNSTGIDFGKTKDGGSIKSQLFDNQE